MCGISGLYSKDLPSREMLDVVSSMVNTQFHRGPDNEEVLAINENLCFGHNRLAIIDLSSHGNQPFVSHCGNYYVTYNGEIYNYLELKSNLDYEFRTQSDTEVLLAAYIKYGFECVNRFNGMFAFSIYDRKKDLLFCARDRIGEKPFVYSEFSKGFIFASELPAIVNTGLVSTVPDEVGIAYSKLRNYLHVPEPFTSYKSIRRLEPAHCMVVRNGVIEHKWLYWKPDFTYDKMISTEEVYNVIDEAIRLRERADVGIATLLSGGVDSSLITAQMIKHGLNPVAYTMKSDDEELNRATAVAKQLNIKLKIFQSNPDMQRILWDKMTRIYGERINLYPLTLGARLFKSIQEDDIKVVMVGNGADEIFYGYDGANLQLLYSDILRFIDVLPNKMLTLLSKICTKNKRLSQLFQMATMANQNRKAILYRDEAEIKRYHGDFGELLEYWGQFCNSDKYIDVANWTGLMSENAHSVTIAGDLPSMLYSVETRAPFLDHNVVELAFKIDAHRKISRKKGVRQNKLILKEAFINTLPEYILFGKKKGFGYGLKE